MTQSIRGEKRIIGFFFIAEDESRFLPHRASLGLSVVRLEADLQHPVAERVPVKGLDRHETLVVVGHRDEAEALALVRLQVSDHLDVLFMGRTIHFLCPARQATYRGFMIANSNRSPNIIALTWTAPKGPKSCQRMFSSVSGARL